MSQLGVGFWFEGFFELFSDAPFYMYRLSLCSVLNAFNISMIITTPIFVKRNRVLQELGVGRGSFGDEGRFFFSMTY